MLKSKGSLLVAGFVCFLLAGFLVDFFLGKPSSPQSIVEDLSAKLENEITFVEQDAAAVLTQLQEDSLPQNFVELKCPFYVFEKQQIVYWSDNTFVPSYASVADTFRLKLLKAGNGDYLARKWSLDNQRVLIVILPLYRKFNITNNYLAPEWNHHIFPNGNVQVLAPNGSVGLPICLGKECLFKVDFQQADLLVDKGAKKVALILFSMAILLGV